MTVKYVYHYHPCMSGSLPNIKVGRDAEADMAPEDLPTYKIEYLNYEVIPEHGWDIDDEDLFEKAAEADLDEKDHGTYEIRGTRYILDGAEDDGKKWPFECRAASCAYCTIILKEGELKMDMDLILTDEEVTERGIYLSCQSIPKSEEVKIVYNAMLEDYLQENIVGVREV
jgi:ferredoxin